MEENLRGVELGVYTDAVGCGALWVVVVVVVFIGIFVSL